jgi:hypothetical protein
MEKQIRTIVVNKYAHIDYMLVKSTLALPHQHEQQPVHQIGRQTPKLPRRKPGIHWRCFHPELELSSSYVSMLFCE